MKRWIPLLALLFFAAAVSGSHSRQEARADPLRYAVAADSNVWFYSSEREEDRLFLLPETYYVRVLSEGETFSAVEYLVNDPPYRKVMGYCRTAALTFVDFVPARPYLRKQITVAYTLDAPAFGAMDNVFGDLERTFVYYGDRYESGQLYLYVLLDGTFGYIPSETPPEFERNDDWLNIPAPPVSGETEAPMSEDGTSVLQIVLLCAVVAVAIGIAFLVLRTKRPPGDGPA